MCAPLRIDIPGGQPVIAECHRDISTETTTVRLFIGAGLIITVTPETADQIADAVCELAAESAVYVS